MIFKKKHKKARPYVPRKIKTFDEMSEEILIKEIARNPYLGLRIALKGQGIDIPAKEAVLDAAREELFRNILRDDPELRERMKQNYLSKTKITRDIGREIDDMINRSLMEHLRNDPELKDTFERRVRKANKKSPNRIPSGYLEDIVKFKKVIDSLPDNAKDNVEDTEDSSPENTDYADTEAIEENDIEDNGYNAGSYSDDVDTGDAADNDLDERE